MFVPPLGGAKAPPFEFSDCDEGYKPHYSSDYSVLNE
jgi:hypothetical protein